MPAAGLTPTRRLLPNGLVALSQRIGTHPAVTLAISVPAGAVLDPPGREGLAHFVSRIVDRGTASRSSDAIALALDDRGVSLSLGVTRHLFVLNCSCLVEDAPAIVELVGELVAEPVFPLREVEARRAEVITSIRQDDDSPAAVAGDAVQALLYGAHPYGRPIKGTTASVQAATRDDLLDFHRARFTPDGSAVAIVGDLDAERAGDLIERAFGSWTRTAQAAPAVPAAVAPAVRQRRVIPMMEKAQVDIAYGFTAMDRRDPQYYAALLMNNVLGQYGLGGRLGDSIRERQGLAYYVYSTLDADLAAGTLTVRAGVAGEHVDRAVATIDEEVDRLRRDGVTAAELADARRYLIGSMPRLLETNDGVATFLLTAEHFGLGADFDRRLPGLLEAVSLEEVNAVAARLLRSEHASIAIAGPYADTPAGLAA